jgi:lipoprotein signal peptidase
VLRDLSRRLARWYRLALEHGTLRLATLLGIAAFLFDWATKSWALRALGDTAIPLGWLTLFVARNEAFAFSSQEGAVLTGLVVVVRLAMILLIVLLSRRLAVLLSRRTACGAALLLAGGLGNSADLVFRGGAVVDFIAAGPFTFDWGTEPVRMIMVFNTADVFILIGIGLLAPRIRDLGRAAQQRMAAWERGLLQGGLSSSMARSVERDD